ncbi:hypothetical protein LBWT_X4840 (plasmid) [Leptolyngbya boryana IAM M-101]|nr:hypothetical protein LBWT_X4840 [Leptolyngbya boryana IAM M-101]BAS66760.1 hypothetical protein LBDG_X4840 [Leptolyngbya boryana dg5]
MFKPHLTSDSVFIHGNDRGAIVSASDESCCRVQRKLTPILCYLSSAPKTLIR